MFRLFLKKVIKMAEEEENEMKRIEDRASLQQQSEQSGHNSSLVFILKGEEEVKGVVVIRAVYARIRV